MISYEAFEETMETLKKFSEEMEPLSNFLRAGGPWEALYSQTIKLLAHSFCDGTELQFSSMRDDIEYFVYECNFGKSWYDGMMTDENDKPVDWSTYERFYDYQVKESIRQFTHGRVK